MTNRKTAFLAMALSLALASCGGGGSSGGSTAGGGGGSGSTPPPPPPPPPPGPTYTAFADVEGDRDFLTACAGVREGVGINGAQVFTNGGHGYGAYGKVYYDAAADSFEVSDSFGGAPSALFTPADLLSDGVSGRFYAKPSPANASEEERFELHIPASNVAGYPHSRWMFIDIEGEIEERLQQYCTAGVPTQFDDASAHGYDTFDLEIHAYPATGPAEITDTTLVFVDYAAVSFDPEDGSIDASLDLALGSPGTYYRFTTETSSVYLATSIDYGTADARLVDGSGNAITLSGSIYGPGAKEIGLAINGAIDSDGDGTDDYLIIGVITGRGF